MQFSERCLTGLHVLECLVPGSYLGVAGLAGVPLAGVAEEVLGGDPQPDLLDLLHPARCCTTNLI